MGIGSDGIKTGNIRLRFFLIVSIGAIMLVGIMYWQSQDTYSPDFTPFRSHSALKRELNDLSSENYQVQVQDTSPSAK